MSAGPRQPCGSPRATGRYWFLSPSRPTRPRYRASSPIPYGWVAPWFAPLCITDSWRSRVLLAPETLRSGSAGSRVGENDKLLGRSCHRDVAIDRSLDAVAERFRVDEDDQIELEPLRQFRGKRSNARRRPERGITDHTSDSVGVRSEPSVENSVPFRGRSVYDGDAAGADGGRHVGIREHGADDWFGRCHDLRRRPVIDAEGCQVDPVEPDALEPFRPGLREAVPGLSAVPDDGEAPGRAA